MLTFDVKSKARLFSGSMERYQYSDLSAEMAGFEQEAVNASNSFKFTLNNVRDFNNYINKSMEAFEMLSAEGFIDKAISLFKSAVKAIGVAIKQLLTSIVNFFKFIGNWFKEKFINIKKSSIQRKVDEFVNRNKYGSQGSRVFDALNEITIKSVVPYSKLSDTLHVIYDLILRASGNNTLINSYNRFILNTIRDVSNNPESIIDDKYVSIVPVIKTFNDYMENYIKSLNGEVKFLDSDPKEKFKIDYISLETSTVIKSSISRTTVIAPDDGENVSFAYVKPIDMENIDKGTYSTIFGSNAEVYPKPVDYKVFDFFETNDLNEIIRKCNTIKVIYSQNIANNYKFIEKLYNESNEMLNIAVPALQKFENAIDKVEKTGGNETDEAERSVKFKLVMGLFKSYLNNLTTGIYALRAEHTFNLTLYKTITNIITEINVWNDVVYNTINNNMDDKL